EKITNNFQHQIEKWLNMPAQKQLLLQHSTYEIVQHVMELARNTKKEKAFNFPSLLTDEDILAMN
ncbi:hypothetical protein ACSTKT_23965, partial [Vibrio parahaemolyticus]